MANWRICFLVLVLAAAARADTFERPRAFISASKDSNLLVRIEPGSDGSGGAPRKPAHCIFFRFSNKKAAYERWHEFDLVNPVLPMTVLVPNDGSFLVTFDDYYEGDATQNTVVAYNDKGIVMKRWALEDILPESEIQALRESLDSLGHMIHGEWHQSVGIREDSPGEIWIDASRNPSGSDGKARMFVLDLRTLTIKADQWRRSDSFEERLYATDRSSPHLTKTELEEIKAQFALRTEYFFLDATRERVDRIVVYLALKTDRYKGVKLRFEKKGEKWIENTKKAEAVEYLTP